MSFQSVLRSVLWCVAACGSVLCDGVCCSVLQCDAVRCCALQSVAECCSGLQRVAACCSVALYEIPSYLRKTSRIDKRIKIVSQCVADVVVWCCVLQYVAVCCRYACRFRVCCSVLQCVKICCSMRYRAICGRPVAVTSASKSFKTVINPQKSSCACFKGILMVTSFCTRSSICSVLQ